MKIQILLIALSLLTCFTIDIPAQVSLVWEKTYPENQKPAHSQKDMISDSSGNIYMTGNKYSGSSDIVTVKYNTSGEILWSATYKKNYSSFDSAHAISIDKQGNVYVT
ncbi:MAG: hypothetical protein ABI462_14650, partial [Ignavibacteria bacterium]